MTIFHVSLECVSDLMQALEVTLTTGFMGLQFYSVGFSENGEPTVLSFLREAQIPMKLIPGAGDLKINE